MNEQLKAVRSQVAEGVPAAMARSPRGCSEGPRAGGLPGGGRTRPLAALRSGIRVL